jgi:DNA-binding CsgD family transcriptional regulator
MHPPIFVREPSAEERARLEAALRAPDAFTVRRAQIVLASADGRRPRTIARDLRCATQTVRNGIRAFNATGLVALTAGSSVHRHAPALVAHLHDPERLGGTGGVGQRPLERVEAQPSTATSSALPPRRRHRSETHNK